MQELYGSLEGERGRIGPHGCVKYVLVVVSKEKPYHMLKGKAEPAPVLRMNLLNSDEGALS